ncbi:hypothetical protein B5E91_11240 [Thomasclavelia spiroformis]|uniref:Uncharacterized protein n=1 Tax=Thomasclavelia spiroformis TaxID=29348 RepID=A0A1Y4PUR9_9FIRM|nr:hypothetical protein [Thomasclavelia spiroformis]OUP96743.1 hypothetical protein B5E98_12400 [Thomasclavelia spiroformis]OUQ04262.1 hypothetical protein B5E91_11240 [Thomasclavelia spiroformis]
MDLLIPLLIILVALITLYIFQNKKKKDASTSNIVKVKKKNNYLLPVQLDTDLFMIVNELSVIEQPTENKLVEIKDSKLISRINEAFPHIGQLVLNSQNLKNNLQTAQQINDFNNQYDGKLYEVIIPANTKLFNSKSMQGAVRGGYLDINKQTKQANFMPVDTLNVSDVNTVANLTTNAMNISSMIVGQYYMAQIDDKLGSIQDDISDIKNFLNDERISKIQQLVINVSVIIKHQDEISTNEAITDKELQKIYDYEEEAGNILAHVNKDISNIVTKESAKNFAEYKENTERLDKLLKEQEVLIKVMNQISSLKYILYHGSASTEYCYERFNIALNQSSVVKEQIQTYQNKETKAIEVDLEKARYRKSYFLDNVIQPVLGVIDENMNYINLEEILLNKIKMQVNNKKLPTIELNIYEEDTKLLIQDGKIYYKYQ